MPPSARMSDVAKLAGVSTMTVSRVLNANPNVLEETRVRVFAAIEQLGYRRNELARSLRERRSRQIGILVPNLYDPFFAQCAHCVSTVAKQHSYSVSIATTDEDPEAEYNEASRMLLRHTDGLVLIPAEGDGSASRLLAPEFESMPFVVLDRPLPNGGRRADTVLVENKRGAQLGTEHLLALGQKRVAFVGLDRKLFTMRARQEGYEAAMAAAGQRPEVLLVSETQGSMEEGLRALMASPMPPTALFCANNLTTRHALQSLQNMGIHPPHTVALVGFDDFETANLLGPGITVVRQPVEALARQAADILFGRLGVGDAVPPGTPGKRSVLPVELVVRGSCGARAHGKVPPASVAVPGLLPSTATGPRAAAGKPAAAARQGPPRPATDPATC